MARSKLWRKVGGRVWTTGEWVMTVMFIGSVVVVLLAVHYGVLVW